MKLPELGPGVALGIGKTNYRVGMIDGLGEVIESPMEPTPDNVKEFFASTARTLLEANFNGAEWAVMGIPGPVKVQTSRDGVESQNFRFTQIKDLSKEEGFDPIEEMSRADSAARELLESDEFSFLTVNDGDLAAQAAAYYHGAPQYTDWTYSVIGDLIVGSGVGGAVVRRDSRFPGANLFHPDPGLWEVGHRPVSPGLFSHTTEQTISGPAVEKHTGHPNRELRRDDPIFDEVAEGMMSPILDFALNAGAELVVISGGFAVNTARNYSVQLGRLFSEFSRSRNPMRDKLPIIKYVTQDMCDTYELYGARGAMLSHVTRKAIDKLVAETS